MKKQHMGITYMILENGNGQYEVVIGKAHYITDSLEIAVLVAKQEIEA